MSIPAPELDDQKFQDIVNNLKQMIWRRCPEWTDHNVSDPGVTLIELFAQVAEMLSFRMNQVPERNYIKFLEMLGIGLAPQTPATTDLRFTLTAPIKEGAEPSEARTLLARVTSAGTPRTELEESIEFALDHDLEMVPPVLSSVMAVPAGTSLSDPAPGRVMDRSLAPLVSEEAFTIYGAPPEEGDALYFGFESDARGNTVRLSFDVLTGAAQGLLEDCPSQVWQYWDVDKRRFEPAELLDDTTKGFNRNGQVVLALPRTFGPTTIGGRLFSWLRCVYTLDENEVVSHQGLTPQPYRQSPAILDVRCACVGGTVAASHCVSVENEVLGQSDGTPGQVFRVSRQPMVDLDVADRVLVAPVSMDSGDETYQIAAEPEEWLRVLDFSKSAENDRHFVCDPIEGTITFGPNLIGPDGNTNQFGGVPQKGMSVILSSYRYGGGSKGNVRAHSIRILKQSLAYISEVTNPRIATGGNDRETVEHAKLKALKVLKVRNRAVTPEDYEVLAVEASKGVGRAKCIQAGSAEGVSVPAGHVRVLVVPSLSRTLSNPSYRDLRVVPSTMRDVKLYLDERRLLTTVVDVAEPSYVFASVHLTFVPSPGYDPELVAQGIREKLYEHIHPLVGGAEGRGWMFGRSLSLADVYATVGRVAGVAYLMEPSMFISKVEDFETGRLSTETAVLNAEGIALRRDQVLVSREHRVKTATMAQV